VTTFDWGNNEYIVFHPGMMETGKIYYIKWWGRKYSIKKDQMGDVEMRVINDDE